jgi:predicted DNA-binding protein
MKRVKQYKIRLTEEEDNLLQQKAQKSGLSVADIIRLGIKSEIQDIEITKAREIVKKSQFIENWDRIFREPIFQEFEQRWQNVLQRAYLSTLARYNSSVRYLDNRFEVMSILVEVGEVEEEIESETIPEQAIKEAICQSLTKFLGGEWNGDELIVNMFVSGLKVDLAYK